MSSSAIIAARKRIEANLRSFSLPTSVDSTVADEESVKNGPFLLSLLQSRLNWLNVFIRYRQDPIQQPRRAINTRRKWPHMRFLGTCTVELGPHSFAETSFYEALRSESWSRIAEAAGLADFATDAEDQNTETQEEKDLIQKKRLVYSDIVMEFKEAPGERLVFPKDTIIQVNSSMEILGSFLLPMDPGAANDFFRQPSEKIALWGSQCNIPQIRQQITAVPLELRSDIACENKVYQPANIRLLQVNPDILDAILSVVHSPHTVREQMEAKLKTVPERMFLQLSKTDKTIEVSRPGHKAYTVPEIGSGPIQAEKKRNEALNAIRLGKRSRSDIPEELVPKGKSINSKEDGFRKCYYCSTKATSMWRKGPEGTGTLCNGCGLLWAQGKILKGAPVISKEEEKKRRREQWEKERELMEHEEWERARHRQKPEPNRPAKTSAAKIPTKATPQSHQPHQQPNPTKGINCRGMARQPLVNIAPHPAQPLPHAMQDPIPIGGAAATTTKEKSTPSPLYNSTLGIPLPTLSIGFGSQETFVHPHCSVTLKNTCFSVNLNKDDNPPATVNIAKRDLRNAKFEVTEDDGTDTQKALLILTLDAAEGPTIRAFDIDLLSPDDNTQQMVIKFLEKRDINGDGIVKRILETWLDTPIVSEAEEESK
ncbi:hypothetical protein BX666DRAFT_1859656 [Dichotomocladium elegans]|nr:hypothetical protein BX666DRAFT_1859656 [Dichotomocladium elegans]